MKKGLVGAVNEAVPNCYPGYCVRDIVKNAMKYKAKVAQLIWRAASTYSKKRFEECLRLIELVTPECGSYIKDIPHERWANSFFPAKRFGHITSNVAESCDAMMKEVRRHFPFNAVVEFLKNVSAVFNDRLQEHTRSSSPLPSKVLETIKKATKVSSKLSVRSVRDGVFTVGRVKNGESPRVVDTVKKTCTCGWYQEHGIPCYHACAVMMRKGIPAEALCSDLVKTETIVRLYSSTIYPIDSDGLDEVTLIAPDPPKKIGRPKGKRMKSHLEQQPLRRNRCSLCGKLGHNKRSCPDK